MTSEEINNLAKDTVGQFDNPLYRNVKSEKLTASFFGDVIKKRPKTSPTCLVKRILSPSNFSTPATEYGKMNESVAIQRFTEERGLHVEPCGLFLDEQFQFLGASPDGNIFNNFCMYWYIL